MGNRTGIEVKSINKKIKNFYLKNISFSLFSSQIVSIIGQNGSGKTTLLNMIAGNFEPDSGFITNIPKKELGFMFDQNTIPIELNINDYEKIFPYLFNNWDKKEFHKFINKFNLPFRKPLKEFSKGMVAKFNISILLSHSPKYLLLDEITSGLDPLVRDDVLNVIKNYVIENNACAIMTTHILDDVLDISNYIIILDNGEITAKKNTASFDNIDSLKEFIKNSS